MWFMRTSLGIKVEKAKIKIIKLNPYLLLVIAILILVIISFHTFATVIKNKRSKTASISDL